MQLRFQACLHSWLSADRADRPARSGHRVTPTQSYGDFRCRIFFCSSFSEMFPRSRHVSSALPAFSQAYPDVWTNKLHSTKCKPICPHHTAPSSRRPRAQPFAKRTNKFLQTEGLSQICTRCFFCKNQRSSEGRAGGVRCRLRLRSSADVCMSDAGWQLLKTKSRCPIILAETVPFLYATTYVLPTKSK